MTDGPNLLSFSKSTHHGRVAITDFAALSGGIRSIRSGSPALPITCADDLCQSCARDDCEVRRIAIEYSVEGPTRICEGFIRRPR